MKNFRLIAITSILALVFFALVVFIISKYLVINLQVSQKYQEIDLSSEIENAEAMSQISLVFLLILSVIFIGVLVTSKIRKK